MLIQTLVEIEALTIIGVIASLVTVLGVLMYLSRLVAAADVQPMGKYRLLWAAAIGLPTMAVMAGYVLVYLTLAWPQPVLVGFTAVTMLGAALGADPRTLRVVEPIRLTGQLIRFGACIAGFLGGTLSLWL